MTGSLDCLEGEAHDSGMFDTLASMVLVEVQFLVFMASVAEMAVVADVAGEMEEVEVVEVEVAEMVEVVVVVVEGEIKGAGHAQALASTGIGEPVTAMMGKVGPIWLRQSFPFFGTSNWGLDG